MTTPAELAALAKDTAETLMNDIASNLRVSSKMQTGVEVRVKVLDSDVAHCQKVIEKALAAALDSQAQEVERLRKAMQLAECQYMGGGGRCRPDEVVESMRSVLNTALAPQVEHE